MKQNIIFSGVNIGMTPLTIESLLFSGRASDCEPEVLKLDSKWGLKLFLYYQIVAEMLKLIYFFV